MSASLPEQVLELLRRAGLAGADEIPAAQPLAGGVSSDIWRVDLGSGPICVKRALPRLRVAQVWEAPVERNRYECEWLRVARQAAPRSVPEVLACGDGLFAMEYLAYPVWKEQLRQRDVQPGFAAKVGAALAAIHAATAGSPEIARRFATDAIFHAIRLEPYLLATAQKHADLKVHLSALVERTAGTKQCLVHGDVSPKNILVAPDGPVFLDAECAWYGDPAFDLAFCLNHLLLKCAWLPQAKAQLLECFGTLADTYLSRVSFRDVQERTAALLPALLLARVDGKSPVEYLTEDAREFVRRSARALIGSTQTLKSIRKAWQESSM